MRTAAITMLLAASALAGTADDDWNALIALDAGPGVQPKTEDEARDIALGHLKKQEAALRGFLSAHSGDKRAFETRLRLVRLLNMRADMTTKPSPPEVGNLLKAAEAAATSPEEKTELDFALLTREMRAVRGRRPTPDERDGLLKAVRAFQKAHRGDRRIPALLVEVSNPFEAVPSTKQSLLTEAKILTEDSALLAQIADDQKRLSFVGKKLPLRFVSLDGKRHTAEAWAGTPAVILFFATWSEPSVKVFADIEAAAKQAGAIFVTISLDADRAALDRFLREQKSDALAAWDGKGWNSPLILALGLNAIPATWLLDKQGVLRSLDILDDPAGFIRQVAR